MDMLVKLYELPSIAPSIEEQTRYDIQIRRALAPEKHLLGRWVEQEFNLYWRGECEVALTHQPATCFVAVKEGRLIGFSCYDAIAKGFFGPIGVSEAARGKNTGKALLLACLHDMFHAGYGYGIIGGVGPAEFYAKIVGATPIDGSVPGIYAGMLRPESE